MEEGDCPPPSTLVTPNLGKLIAEAKRDMIKVEDLQEQYEEIKRLIADKTKCRVVCGSVDGFTKRIKLTLDLR